MKNYNEQNLEVINPSIGFIAPENLTQNIRNFISHYLVIIDFFLFLLF